MENAEEEVFYLHPLTRAALEFAMLANGDMPKISGLPGDVAYRQPFQVQPRYGADFWQGRVGAGD
eukprot:537602-Lingulodinium_polyedra.AAC.1